jgi:RNA polymerase primary sigma factor
MKKMKDARMAANTLKKNVRRAQSVRKTAVRRTRERPRLKTELELRTRQFLEHEIDFVPNRQFRSEKAQLAILGQPLPAERMTPAAHLPRDLPAHLARLCEAELLSAEGEAMLFRRMNYLKFRANVVRAQLNPDRPNRQQLEVAQAMLAEATEIRGRIIRANMRLVISIVKKFVGPQNSFDDMLSEGTMSLMHAVDKFDFDRGFRFSTYAYRAIARNAYRTIMDRHRDSSRFASGSEDVLFDVVDEHDSGWISEHTWNRLRKQMGSMLDQLDRREQFIIRSRFALGAHRKVRTFQSLADRLGISKERVRQLEQRAVDKLRRMATAAAAE